MTLFDLAKLEAEIDRTNREIEQEGFWDDPDKAQKDHERKEVHGDYGRCLSTAGKYFGRHQRIVELAEADNESIHGQRNQQDV